MIKTQRARWMALGLGLAVVAVYGPGLWGPFLFDDFANILPRSLPDGRWSLLWDVIWSNGSGPLKRPVSNLSFLLQNELGFNTEFAFKSINLLIHLLCGWALFRLAKRLAMACGLQGLEEKANAIAMLTAAIWLLHPLWVSTVLYAVQRMSQLSALFCLLFLAEYLVWRQSTRAAAAWRSLALMSIFAFLAIFSKENAILLAFWVLILEWALPKPRPRPYLYRVVVGSAVAACLALCVYVVGKLPEFADTYDSVRHFSLGERLLTQIHALFFYVRQLLLPDISQMGLYHDDFAVITEINAVTLLLGTLLVAAIVAAIIYRRTGPIVPIAILGFLAGHLLESTVIPLELVFEHRNYLPAVFPIWGLACLVALKAPWRRSTLLVTLVVLTLLAALTATRSYRWGNLPRFVATQSSNHPYSPSVQYNIASILLSRGDLEMAAERWRLVSAITEGRSESYVFKSQAACIDNRHPIQDADIATLRSIRKRGKAVDASVDLTRQVEAGLCPYSDAARVEEVIAAMANSPAAERSRKVKARLHVLLGRIHASNQQLEEAIANYRIAHNVMPATGEWLLAAAYAALNAGELDIARTLYRELIDHGRAVGTISYDIIAFEKTLECLTADPSRGDCQ